MNDDIYCRQDKPRAAASHAALSRQVSAPVVGRSTPPVTPSPSGSTVSVMPTPSPPPASAAPVRVIFLCYTVLSGRKTQAQLFIVSKKKKQDTPTPPSPTPSAVPGLSLQSHPTLTHSGSSSFLNRSPRSLAMQPEAGASILPAEGFRVENGKKSPLPGLELNVYDFSDHYRTNFAGKKQVHFVGYMSAGTVTRVCCVSLFVFVLWDLRNLSSTRR